MKRFLNKNTVWHLFFKLMCSGPDSDCPNLQLFRFLVPASAPTRDPLLHASEISSAKIQHLPMEPTE
jgi:hypothetical protein